MTGAFFTFIYPAAVGIALGIFYYGGLWLILRRLPQLRHPSVWVGLSLLVRTVTVVVVLYLLFADSWQQLLIAMLGMLIARTLLVQRIKPKAHRSDKHAGQVS